MGGSFEAAGSRLWGAFLQVAVGLPLTCSQKSAGVRWMIGQPWHRR